VIAPIPPACGAGAGAAILDGYCSHASTAERGRHGGARRLSFADAPHRELTLGMMLIGIAVAFGLGAAHALSPGHGKTIVAAYLVGSRGTFKHAIFLGGMVTFTHTVSVFMLGFTTLFLSKYVAPERFRQCWKWWPRYPLSGSARCCCSSGYED